MFVLKFCWAFTFVAFCLRGQDLKPVKRNINVRKNGIVVWPLSLEKSTSPMAHSNRFKDTGYHIQRYQAGEYYHWHVDSGPGVFSQRQLVALWYLNDVQGPGGETEFAFQDLSVQPTAGDLLLFPPFWTHIHRSKTLESGSKYIATTWICFAWGIYLRRLLDL